MQDIIKLRVAACKKYARCNYFYHCEQCAKIRQARFADKAQAIFRESESINLLRVTPDIQQADEIKRIKNAIKRGLQSSPALWTIEQGQLSGLLHINVLTTIDNFKPIKRASQNIERGLTNIRSAAAYILKKNQYPDPAIWNSRTFGTFGQITEICLNSKKTPNITAAAAEVYLKNNPYLNPIYLQRQIEIHQKRNNWASYKEKALSNLPNLRAFIDANKGNKKDEKN